MEIVTESLHDIVQGQLTNANNRNQASAHIDMRGFDCAVFIVDIHDSAATGKAELRLEGSDTTTSADFAQLDVEEISATAAAGDGLNGKVLRIEVYRPLQRYLRARILSTVANIAFGACHALRYGARRIPPVGSDDVLDQVVAASPGYK